jgi:hypothetical protein
VNCCTFASCGNCGRCDDEPRRDDYERDDESCDYCHGTIGLMTSRISLASVGVFCSRKCADVATLIHAKRMQRVSA